MRVKHSIRIIILLLTVVMGSCSEYQKILKSSDLDYKYEKAVEYFNNGEYAKAQTLFNDLTAYYRGTERAEDVINYLALSYTRQKLYESAYDYFMSYIRNYPKGKYIANARYMAGHCCYLDSPDARLDQTKTIEAIDLLTRFVELYPDNDYTQQAYREIDEMYDKLAYKEYLSAKLYYNLGTYLGNNYESAIIVAQNALKKYPSNQYQEELAWIVLEAKNEQVKNSVYELRLERARDAYDEYYNFITDFPDSKHRRAADKIGAELKKITKDNF